MVTRGSECRSRFINSTANELRMVRRLALLLVVGDVGCRATPPPTQDGEVIDRGIFAFVVDGDTTVIDEYWRSATTLEGIVQPRRPGAKFGWARYHVVFSPAGDALRADLTLGRVGSSPQSAPVDSLTTTLGPGVITEEWPNRPPTQVNAERGAIPLFAPSIAMFQEVIRRAHRLSGRRDEIEIPLYSLLNRAEVQRVHVTWIMPDTASVSGGGYRDVRYVVDPSGRIVSAQTAKGEFTTIRLR
jgi:hypothetical protein